MSSYLWMSCRSALVARARYRPARRVLGPLPSVFFAPVSLPSGLRIGLRRLPLRSIGCPAVARWAIPAVPPVARPSR